MAIISEQVFPFTATTALFHTTVSSNPTSNYTQALLVLLLPLPQLSQATTKTTTTTTTTSTTRIVTSQVSIL